MPNAFTKSTVLTNLVQTAYDRYIEFALRAEPLHRTIADKRPVQQAMPGSSVVFQLYADLAVATTPLTEDVDPDSVAMSNTSTVTVTLNEYGNPVLSTRKLSLFSLSDVDPAIANEVAWNMVDSLDSLVLDVLRQGTNKIVEASGNLVNAGATNTVTGTDTIKSRDVRYIVAKLRTNKARPRKGTLYWCGIHPEVSHDLRAETGSAAWRDPHVYSAPNSIWAGELGEYEGAYFIETPRAYNTTDGAASARVFRTIFAGQQALAEAVAEEPHIVLGNVTDKLMRFRPVSWYGVLGWARYREPALFRVETTSSIDNT